MKQRTIKFRTWDSIAKIMYEAFNMNDLMSDTDLRPMAEHYIYLQFTGLLDKNGKEIYEGDIFNCIYETDGHVDHNYVVTYSNEQAKFFLLRKGVICSQIQVVQTMTDASRHEIIGNIYEGLHSGEKLDILDKWKKNTDDLSQKASKDTLLAKKPEEKSE